MPAGEREQRAQREHVPRAEDEVAGRRLAVVEQDVRAGEEGIVLFPADRLLGEVVAAAGQCLRGDGTDRDEPTAAVSTRPLTNLK
jgi:hypothetical protein